MIGNSRHTYNIFGIFKFVKYKLEIPIWSGYYLWRDAINLQGGICVGGDTNALVNNECKGGKRYYIFLFIL